MRENCFYNITMEWQQGRATNLFEREKNMKEILSETMV